VVISDYITPVMFIDSDGRFAILNNYLEYSNLLSNHVNKTSISIKLINNPVLGAVLGNVSYTVTVSDKSADLFYTYSCYGLGSMKYGVGINVGGWVGLYGFVSTPGEIGVGAQVTPWIHASDQIGVSGIGASIGINIGNTAHDLSVNIGWGTLLVLAIASVPIPGARGAAVATAAVLLIAAFIQYGDGGYYF